MSKIFLRAPGPSVSHAANLRRCQNLLTDMDSLVIDLWSLILSCFLPPKFPVHIKRVALNTSRAKEFEEHPAGPKLAWLYYTQRPQGHTGKNQTKRETPGVVKKSLEIVVHFQHLVCGVNLSQIHETVVTLCALWNTSKAFQEKCASFES